MAKTDAQERATSKYDAKTYKLYGFKLRVDEDADLIALIEEYKSEGKSMREILRAIYEG